jgi:hypothetical protein
MLTLAKAQSRVTHARDDAYITELLGQSIDDVERTANATVFDRTITQTADWLAPAYWIGGAPASCIPGWISAPLPFNNVRTLTAVDADGVDVSDAYVVRQADPGGVAPAYLEGPIVAAPAAAGVVLTFAAGMVDPTKIAPALRRMILRRCAALYENREAPLTLAEPMDDGAPLVWRPSV